MASAHTVADLVITGGLVIDGTGGPGVIADVTVDGGRVVAVGPAGSAAGGKREIDATGLIVAPGFVDLHTHYDAQLDWDPAASPSPQHGVTTVMGGNCGFGLAPVGPGDTDYLTRLMSQVEGIPLAAMESTLKWDWSTFGEWLGRFDGRIGVNAGFLVGHSTVRRAVMGDRSHEPAGPEEVAAMVLLLHAALDDGAIGFSTSQAPTHRDGNGDPVPSRGAERSEIIDLARTLRAHAGTQVEFIIPGCLSGFTPDEVEFMGDLSLAAGRPANWNVLAVSSMNPTGHLDQLRSSTAAAERGARVVALTLPHSMGVRLSFLTGAVLSGLPGWGTVLGQPEAARLAALADPAVRALMAAGAQSDEAGVLRFLADWRRLRIIETFAPANDGLAGRAVGDVARERGLEPFDALLDVVIADRLRTGLKPPIPEPTEVDWRLRAEAWLDGRTIVGGSDAGAHLDMMCGAVYSTSLLASVRDHHTVTWEQAVHLLTDAPASLYGLIDRGRLAPGYSADITIFDPATVGASAERTVDDLPGGTSRIFADATGIEHVLVNGTTVVSEGRLTGSLPGAVLRSGRGTRTVSVPGSA
ncbi:MAG TPA: amidohydrolase family protein [Acidimicrobiales bacterium]|jgi:N-acyl-D-aspartate/D-glutamate deacylase|nr:amidohydrolase family protein [Acidimicrobiales bacterium]